MKGNVFDFEDIYQQSGTICGFIIYYVYDVGKYVAADDNGDIVASSTDLIELDDHLNLEYGGGPGYVGP